MHVLNCTWYHIVKNTVWKIQETIFHSICQTLIWMPYRDIFEIACHHFNEDILEQKYLICNRFLSTIKKNPMKFEQVHYQYSSENQIKMQMFYSTKCSSKSHLQNVGHVISALMLKVHLLAIESKYCKNLAAWQSLSTYSSLSWEPFEGNGERK